jgi:hypothetical protein
MPPATPVPTTRPPRRARYAVGLALAAVVAFAVAGCGGSAGGAGHGSTATASPTGAAGPVPSTSAADQAQTLALAAYRAMWADMVAVSATGSYRDPRLGRHASGQAYSLLYRGVYALQRSGLVTKGEPLLHPVALSSTPSADTGQFTIQDCFDDTHWLNYKLDGQRQDDTPGGHERVNAVAIKKSGSWKVDRLAVQNPGTC